MKYNHLKQKLLCSILTFLCSSTLLHSQGNTDTKHLIRSFPVNRETSIEVTNKYGMVTIETWNSDSVKFVISTSATASTAADVATSLANIDFQFVNTEHYIMAKTLFLNPTRIILNDLKSIFSRSNNMNIDYKIYVPKTVNLKVENKFGDIYANALSGNIAITLSYGKLKLYEVNGQLSLDLNYVDNAEIQKMTRGKCTVNFSNLLINQASSLECTSSFSKIDINQVDDIQAQSSQDEFTVTETKNADINGKFSKITLGYVSTSFIGDIKFGTLTFKKLSSNFSKLNIGTKYSDVNIFFNNESEGFDIEISNQKSRIMYPRMYSLKEDLINPKENIYRTIGHIGKQSTSKVYIDAQYGNINLKMR